MFIIFYILRLTATLMHTYNIIHILVLNNGSYFNLLIIDLLSGQFYIGLCLNNLNIIIDNIVTFHSILDTHTHSSHVDKDFSINTLESRHAHTPHHGLKNLSMV